MLSHLPGPWTNLQSGWYASGLFDRFITALQNIAQGRRSERKDRKEAESTVASPRLKDIWLTEYCNSYSLTHVRNVKDILHLKNRLVGVKLLSGVCLEDAFELDLHLLEDVFFTRTLYTYTKHNLSWENNSSFRQCLGVSGSAQQCFSSYLSDKTVSVPLGDNASSYETLFSDKGPTVLRLWR